MLIRKATLEDAEAIFHVEAACFTQAEAATLEAIKERIELFNDICFVCEDHGILGFINGAISKHETISDDFFEHMTNDNGPNVLIFSLGVHPDHQRKSIGRKLLNTMIVESKALNKEKMVLTCKDVKIDYYSSFGFQNDGVADSTHGGSVWYSMSLELQDLTEKEKMISGQVYNPMDPILKEERFKTRRLIRQFELIFEEEVDKRQNILSDFLGCCGEKIYIESFKCDYGYNIYLGENFYANFNLIMLDVCEIRIGKNCMIGPGVHIYTASHSMNSQERNSGLEYGKPVIIGDDVWIGGNSVILPGVVLGDQVVVAAGSVVNQSFPSNVLVAGNPARIVKELNL